MCLANECGDDSCGDVCGVCPVGIPCEEDLCKGATLFWSKAFGGAEDDELVGVTTFQGSAPRLAGNFHGAGFSLGDAPLSHQGGSDLFTAKLYFDGVHLWSKGFGGALDQEVRYISLDTGWDHRLTGVLFGDDVDFGGGIVSHAGSGDVFVLEVDEGGEYLNSFTYGGTGLDVGEAVNGEEEDSFYLVGRYYSDEIDFGGGPLANAGAGTADGFIALLGAEGDHGWSKRFGGTGEERALRLEVDKHDTVVVAGEFTSTKIDLGDGLKSNASAGTYDIVLARLSRSNGEPEWVTNFGGTGDDRIKDLDVSESGYIFIVGEFASPFLSFGGSFLINPDPGTRDIFLAVFDIDGTHQWSKRLGGAGDDRVSSLSAGSAESVYVVGEFSGPGLDFGTGELAAHGGTDGWVAYFDTGGTNAWAMSIGGPGDETFTTVCAHGSTRFYLAGRSSGASLQVDDVEITEEAGIGVFLLALDRD